MNNARNTYNALVAKATAIEAKANELILSDNAEDQQAFSKLWDEANAIWAKANEIDMENGLTEQDLAERKAQQEAERAERAAVYWAASNKADAEKQALANKLPQLKAAFNAAAKLLKACTDLRNWPALDLAYRNAKAELESADRAYRWL